MQNNGCRLDIFELKVKNVAFNAFSDTYERMLAQKESNTNKQINA